MIDRGLQSDAKDDGVLPPLHEADEGWLSIHREIFPRAQHPFWRLLLDFLLHPVKTILRLSEDRTFTGAWKLLLMAIGAVPVTLLVLLPRLGNAVADLPVVATKADVVVAQTGFEILQIVGILVLTPLQFYACRAIGTMNHTPRAYFKLCLMSVSYNTFLSLVGLSAAYIVSVVLLRAKIPHSFPAIQWTSMALTQSAVLAFVAIVHRRFWGMTWLRAIGATAVIALLSWGVVYPGLSALWESWNMPQVVRQLAG